MRTEFEMTKQKFYIATFICACIVVIAACYGWFSQGGEELSQNKPETIMGEAEITEDTAAKPEVQQQEQTEDTSAGVVVSPPQYGLPLEGQLIRQHSEDTLVYYETLDQYMVHTGVDIAAAVGTEVKAAGDGLVSKIITDGEMGVTVWVAYPDEITVVYANLDPNLSVEEGDAVRRGDILGVTGETSIYESAEQPHLHLEVMKGDTSVDPADYFNF